MLNHIHIKNFIIVKSLSLDFQSGLHVLTGETGAGKSIWIDAIEIGLGGRADANFIYPGEKSGEITLCFDLRHLSDAKKWLQEHDLLNDDECIIRRMIDIDKPSRTTINGVLVPQQLTRELAQLILCIHGQHQHQRLLKQEEQENLLDRFADHHTLLHDMQTHYHAWKTIERDVQSLKQQMKNQSSDLTLWQYQLDELTSLVICENEYNQLFSQYQQLHHAKQFASTLNEALNLIDHDDQPAANDLAQSALQRIEQINNSDSKIENIRALLQTATIHLNEARDALQTYCDECDFSSAQLEKIETRLTLLQDVARKHHIDPAELLSVQNALEQKMDILKNADDILLAKQSEQKTVLSNYQKNADKLTQNRNKTAEKLSRAITDHMQQLGMNGGAFHIMLEKNASDINLNGNETIQFLIATNPGQTPHVLSDIVSGGELSRLSLIIQVLTAQKKKSPTLIFDEVDVGIGGKTADLVGKLLHELSRQAQVLCVTHLPQVAACGDHHYFSEKITDGTHTATAMRKLTEDQRIQELARMLSGAKITQKSVLYAKELLTLCHT